MNFTLKNVRTCRGTDGEAYSCTLYIDGVKAAEVSQGGHGGCNDYHWFGGRPAEEAFIAHCRTIVDPEYRDDPEVADFAIAAALDRMAEEKYLRRHCRTKILFRVRGDGEGQWRTLGMPWRGNEERVRAHLAKKYGEKLEEIANERLSA